VGLGDRRLGVGVALGVGPVKVSKTALASTTPAGWMPQLAAAAAAAGTGRRAAGPGRRAAGPGGPETAT
jgi:hypothetical protein